MRLLDKYVIYSSIFALFTEAFFFHFIIDIKLYYAILISNFFILSYYRKITIHKNLLFILGFFLLHGVVNYFFLFNPIKSLVAQLVGISISSVFYYNLVKHYKVKILFNTYLSFSFFIAVIAIPMFFLKINNFSDYRLNGILSEPAHYAVIMLPAVYYFFKKRMYLKLFIVLFTIVLSKSSIGYVGLVLILIIPLLKEKYFIKYSWIVIVTLLGIIFFITKEWNSKIDENKGNQLVRRLKETGKSLNAIHTGGFEKYTNLSSYAFLSNGFITQKSFLNYPLGAGLGGYQYMYDMYYPLLNPPAYLKQLKLAKINRTDANSLFLRMVTELGIFAFFFLIYFSYRSIKLFKKDNKTYQQSTFFYLILKLIREGHYFPPEFYFFLIIFLNQEDEHITHS